MIQNENGVKEAVALFVWLAAIIMLFFLAGILVLRPWTHDPNEAHTNLHDYEANLNLSGPLQTDDTQATINEPPTEYSFLPDDLKTADVPLIDDTYKADDLPPEQVSPYMAYSFFIPENEETYFMFHTKQPDLDAQTVVWMVNVHLHLPFFYKIHINEDPNPLLVNSFYRLPADFMPQNLEPVMHDNCRFRATPETGAAFRKLRASAQEAGFSLFVASAFRTASRQQEIFFARGRRDGAIMRPYHSEHQTGRALDLRGPRGELLGSTGPTRATAWIAENAHLYGFIVRYLAETTHITGIIYEPWHITYVGTDISKYMHENSILSLEEFVGRNPGVGMRVARSHIDEINLQPTFTSGLSLSSVAGPILGTFINSSTD